MARSTLADTGCYPDCLRAVTPHFYNSRSISSIMSILQQVQPRSAEQEIMTCIDRGLESVGFHLKSVVYWHLERIGQISKFEIVDKPIKFVQGLRTLYRGSSAGVENAILQQINTRFDLNCSIGTDLVAAIFQARNKTLA